jgi:hypothetical protein
LTVDLDSPRAGRESADQLAKELKAESDLVVVLVAVGLLGLNE